MSKVFFDMKNGVSGDMVLDALIELSEEPAHARKQVDLIRTQIQKLSMHEHEHNHDQDASHTHSHRSYNEVKRIIDSLDMSLNARDTAHRIYGVIAEAESTVHGDPLDKLHFHEVGRDQAIANIAGVAFCADQGGFDDLICSDICDGRGTVECAHGTLTVPVPAVKAMLKAHDIPYKQTEQDGERVTPSGLAMVIGLGFNKGERPEGTPVRSIHVPGKRSSAGEGLTAELF